MPGYSSKKLLGDYLTQLSHKLRNSVSAADAVVGDKLNGFLLTDDDFKDAGLALDRIKLLLDGMKVVGEALEAEESDEALEEAIKQALKHA